MLPAGRVQSRKVEKKDFHLFLCFFLCAGIEKMKKDPKQRPERGMCGTGIREWARKSDRNYSKEEFLRRPSESGTKASLDFI